MDTAKIYHDSDGNERTINQMVISEPHWAANRIQAGERAIELVAKLKASNKMRAETFNYQIIAIQASYIAGVKEGPEEGLKWLGNYMFGPGLIPSDEEIELGAQAYLDKHQT